MPRPETPSQDPFDRLLDWLAQDREAAATRYQQIHQRLTRLFVCKGCECGEELADQVMDRVAQKVHEMPAMTPDEQVRVFYSFSKFIFLEHERKRAPAGFSLELRAVDSDDDGEKQHRCLDLCLRRIPEAEQHLLLHYYRYGAGDKIRHRKAMAEEMRVAMNALRIKVCRLRAKLEACLFRCVESDDRAFVQ